MRLRFDEFMNVPKEKQQQEDGGCIERRTPMVDSCYYCLCNSCINNAESMTVNPDKDKLPDKWEACFFCDDCREYAGGIAKRNLEREQCDRYIIDNYHAEQKRKKFKVVR